MDINKIFEFNFEHYSEWTKYLFYHPTKTEQEFEEDIKLLFKIHFESFMNQEESFLYVPNLCFYIIPKLQEIGYIEIKPKKIIYLKSYDFDTDEYYENQISEWKNILGDDMFQKAVDHNNKIQESF